MTVKEAAARLEQALADWGVTAKPYEPDGNPWWSHTTPGPWHPEGVMHHHTTGTAKILTDGLTQDATLHLLRKGRRGLPGPLCLGAPAMIPATGRARVWLIGWGNVNHAGLGSQRVLDAVRAGRFNGPSASSEGSTDGNPWFYGLEYLHPGDATAWPDALLDTGHRTACALCEFSGWDRSTWPGRQVEHRDWTSRKIDRSWHGNVHNAVSDMMKEAEVALTDAEIAKIANEVWRGLEIGQADKATPSSRLVHATRVLDLIAPDIAELVDRPLAVDFAAQIGELIAKIDQMQSVLNAHVASPGN